MIGELVWEVPDLEAWDAWRPEEVAERLVGLAAPWHVAGGWALDLWHGRQTREHEDLEIAVPRSAGGAVRRRLAGFDCYVVGDGRVAPLAAEQPMPDDRFQMWVRDPAVRAWRLDVFHEAGDAETWTCRRHEGIREPLSRMVAVSADGVPYLRPEAVLLYKAKGRRDKDEADFDLALPRLDAEARRWLVSALALAHPGHPWQERLSAC
jgi:hypothetical protein